MVFMWLKMSITRVWDAVNIVVTRRPYRLIEVADEWFTPPVLRQACQATLTAYWVERLPILQPKALSTMAAQTISQALLDLEDRSPEFDITVVDFCSGSGGPAPLIEKYVNQQRARQKREPIGFVLSDLFPNIDDWIPLAIQSAHLSFIPQPVDAVDPPPGAMSDLALDLAYHSVVTAKKKVFRLYCLSFHHFGDQEAMKILANTMETADGFAIIELQERRISSLILMILQFCFVFIVQLLWFWRKPSHLFFTYIFPVLPYIMAFDGLVSCLRTRTLDELVNLVIAARANQFHAETILSSVSHRFSRKGEQLPPLQIKDWKFSGGRRMHTFPFGYMTWFVGVRI